MVAAAQSEQQARDLIAQAQKKLKSWSFIGPSNKYEDAAELYEKAGNMFKLAQQCKHYTIHLCRVSVPKLVIH